MPPKKNAPAKNAPALKHAQALEQAPPPLRRAFGIAALVVGAFAMGASVLFVRLADVGPFASAFWRTALALPVLFAWALAADGRRALTADRASLLAGVFFAGDLIFWHLAILGTSVANAAVLATTAPVWVTLFAWLVLRAAIARATLAGLVLCLAGAAALVGHSFRLEPAHLMGDAAGLVTALFFAAYFLAVERARRTRGAGAVTLVSTAATTLILFIVALAAEPTLIPASASGAAALLGLALVSQVGGQGLMAVGLSVVPPVYAALVFFLEVVSAAALGWLVLGEALGVLQGAGMGLVLLGLWVARPRRRG
ncbi:DMT family transporter [Xanthobacter sp. DSM 24535]|uniref:DMT family transporter n=1 Tax=Roseixanthobacter psychrophilus TaxID=3119917 RepID=UPI00372C448B